MTAVVDATITTVSSAIQSFLTASTASAAKVALNLDGIQSIPAASNYFAGDAGNLTLTGGANVGFGWRAMLAATTMTDCVAVGDQALRSATTVVGCTAIGKFSLFTTITGSNNTGCGDSTLRYATGQGNVAVGYTTAQGITTANNGVWIGAGAAVSGAQGNNMVVIGAQAMPGGAGATDSVIIGTNAKSAGSGSEDVAVGTNALWYSTGGRNTAIGMNAGFNNITGTRCIWIGEASGVASQVTNLTNAIAIGTQTYTTKSNQVVLGDSNIVETNLRGKVVINGTLATPRARLDIVGTDSEFLIGASGLTHGLRINATPTELQFQAVDNTLNAAYKPLIFGMSALGFFGATAVTQRSAPSAASDLASAITAVNSIRTSLLNYGLLV